MQKWGWLIGLAVLAKLPLLLTHHIQEDAFITWRVAQNLLDYGVIGFNGEEAISSSTTYLYTFFSAFFIGVFGSDFFIQPILITNILLFTIALMFLVQLITPNRKEQILLFLFLNFIPPSLKIAYMGMEYALLFALFVLFLWNAAKWRYKLLFILLPVLILWTRLDAAIFLGLYFIYDWIIQKRLNLPLMFGGALALISFLGFNYLYFGEWVNHTIIAKRIAYQETSTNLLGRLKNAFFYLSWVKSYSWLIIIPSVSLLAASMFVLFSRIFKKDLVSFLLVFAMVKWILFSLIAANFDWYYWIPQVFLGIAVVFLVFKWFNNQRTRSIIFTLIAIPLVSYIVVHAVATGNGEWNYRAEIGRYLNKIEPDKNQYIMLEPAGYIPYFSKLKTIDEVGLVYKGVNEEMIKDFDNWYYNSVIRFRPKYLLTLFPLGEKGYYTMSDEQKEEIFEQYRYSKQFKIQDKLTSDNPLLEFIYKLKPSGRDYYLYIRKQPLNK